VLLRQLITSTRRSKDRQPWPDLFIELDFTKLLFNFSLISHKSTGHSNGWLSCQPRVLWHFTLFLVCVYVYGLCGFKHKHILDNSVSWSHILYTINSVPRTTTERTIAIHTTQLRSNSISTIAIYSYSRRQIIYVDNIAICCHVLLWGHNEQRIYTNTDTRTMTTRYRHPILCTR